MVPPPHPINRLLVVADGLRALAAELEDIQGAVPPNLVWWADEIDRALADLRNAAADRLPAGALLPPPDPCCE
jgi:hypothetical protein